MSTPNVSYEPDGPSKSLSCLLVRFLVVELIYSDLNSRFDISVVFMTNYSFNERRRYHRQQDAFDVRLHKS
jgi:hypothetical protein